MAKFNLTKLTSKAKEIVDKKGDKIAAGVDKVTDKIDQKTKGKYHDKLEKLDSAAAKLDKTRPADGDAAEEAGAEPAAEAAAEATPAPAEPAEPPAASDQPASFPEPS
jgi:hypothetical protein